MGADPPGRSPASTVVDPAAGGSPTVVLRTARPCAITTGAVAMRAAREARSGSWWLPVAFFLLVATLYPFAVGPDRSLLEKTGGGILWVAALLAALNDLGRKHGIGRLDLVENRFVGMKSRDMYETPGGEIYARAHRGIEQITLDRGAAHLKDELMPKYAELIYNGFWFAPEREMLQAAIDHSQEKVSGTVRLKLYKGSASVVGRTSPNSLYSERHVTFEDDAGAYDQKDAAGFIKLNALRLKLLAKRDR